MNRSVVIVKGPKRREYAVIRIHWNHGQPLVNWLKTKYKTWDKAYDLICQGHRSTIEKPHREIDMLPEHEVFKTLKEAEAWCEHSTLAYYDGKRWKFKGEV